MDSRLVIKKITQAGWEKVRQSGDHVTFKHPDHQQLITITHPRKDLPIGLVKDIERRTGLKLR
ncbi:MAG: type II toxin-antitoxin system HicA family toxin [Deltaproteobacteria bacterium]|nr:type II toxin-antitoxin system HicA family toxin [Deltaproteobacteria bacterium]